MEVQEPLEMFAPPEAEAAQAIQSNKMGVQPEGRLLFTMSLPVVISMLLQALYNIVDSIFVTRLSEDALTAVSLAYPIQMLMIAVAVGTGVGMNALISRRLGQRRFGEASSAATNGLFVLLLSALAFLLFGLFGVRPFFNAFVADDPEIREMGIEYLTICCTLSFGVFLQIGVERIMQAQGKTVYTMLMQLTGAVINIIFDPILIFGLLGFPRLGVAGAAYATVGGQIVAMLLSFFLLFCTKHDVRIRLRRFRPSGAIIRKIYSVGAPSIVMQAIGTVMTLAMNALLIAYTTTAVAVFGVYFKIQSIVFMPVLGMTSAAMSIIAYNYGARCKRRMLRTWRLTLYASLVIMIVGMLCFQLFPGQIFSLFEASDEALRIGMVALRIISPSFVLAAVGITNSTLFQAVGRGVYSMIMSLLRQLVALVPAALALSLLTHNLDRIWLAFPIAEAFSLAVSLFMLHRVRRTILDQRPALAAPRWRNRATMAP